MGDKQLIFMATGGTGGHVLPAKQLAKKLRERGVDSLFIGGHFAHSSGLELEDFAYKKISCSTLSLSNPFKLLSSLISLFKGTCQSFSLLIKETPQLVVGFGSFHSFPLLVACVLKRVPFILYEPNCVMGKVNRLFSKRARAVAALFPTDLHFPKNAQTINLSNEFLHPSREEAIHYFGLDPKKSCLLIFGGSQGAVQINQLMEKVVPLREFQDLNLQILHFIGKKTSLEKVQAQYKKYQIPSCVKCFETKMHYAYSAADFALCRSGAGAIWEQILFSLPTILVPYPFGQDDHQKKNAEFMEKQVGGGVVLRQVEPKAFIQLLKKFMKSENLNGMKNCLKNYKKKRQAVNLSELVLEVLLSEKR